MRGLAFGEPPPARPAREGRAAGSSVPVPDRHPAEFQPPRPFRRAVLPLVGALAALGLWLSALLPAAIGFGVCASSVLAAALLGCAGAYELRRARRLGDDLLRAYPGQQPVSGLAEWRAAELRSDRTRRELAFRLRERRREAERCRVLGGPHVEQGVIDEIVVLLRAAEGRLQSRSEPVSPFGILATQPLAAAGSSPLAHPERAEQYLAALEKALAGLERA